MKVALVAHRYPPALGGVERHVGELARGYVERGIDVEVVTTDPTGALPGLVVEGGVTIHRFRTLGDDSVFYVSPSLGVWLQRNAARFDLIHAHSYHTPLALQALVAARVARRPFVLTTHYHGTGHSTFRRLLHVPYRVLGGVVIRGSRPLICVSDAERALLQGRFGDDLPIVIAPNGVDVDPILAARPFPRPTPGRLVLTAGRLETYKHVDRLLDAVPSLAPDDEVVVLGSGPASGELQRQAGGLGIAERVSFLGHVPTPELHRWLRTADVFVTLSEHEAFGIALLEAGVAGAGVVASDIPAHREVARYLARGAVRLVPPGADAADLARAIAGSARRDVTAEEAARVPSWRDTVDATLHAYTLALGGRLAEVAPPGRP